MARSLWLRFSFLCPPFSLLFVCLFVCHLGFYFPPFLFSFYPNSTSPPFLLLTPSVFFTPTIFFLSFLLIPPLPSSLFSLLFPIFFRCLIFLLSSCFSCSFYFFHSHSISILSFILTPFFIFPSPFPLFSMFSIIFLLFLFFEFLPFSLLLHSIFKSNCSLLISFSFPVTSYLCY